MTGQDDDLVQGELSVGGRDRGFALRLPKTPRGRTPIPLVLALHGRGVDGMAMRAWTTFDQQADRWGMAIAYPHGVAGMGGWADGRGVAPADEAGVDDVAFLSALIDHAADKYGTTPDQNVVAGISNGSFMAHRLAVLAGDRIAVLAAVAGAFPAYLLERRPTHAVSAILLHGVEDRAALIGGGYSRHRGPGGEPRGRTLSLADSAAHWRDVDRCPAASEQTVTTEFSSRTTVTGGVGGSMVTAWTLYGHGHSWPGMPPKPEWSEPTTQEFDGAEEICRFAEPLLIPADRRRL